MSTVFITGTSRGLGRALVFEMNARGYKVIASSRNLDDIRDMDVYKKTELDVTKDDQISKTALLNGEVDILINNAAYTVAGPIESIPVEEIKKEYETNVIGPLKLSRVFIPGMRKKGKGTIVNISSAADRFAPPFGGSYSSAKAALAMISEAMHFELKHFGIKVILLEAGSIRTDMPLKQKHFTSPAYRKLEDQMKKRFESFFKEDSRTPPEKAAKMIADKIENPSTGFREPVGQDAETIISMRSELNDEDWEKSPMFQGLNW